VPERAAGFFHDAAGVIRNGLRLLEEHESKLQALRQAIVEGEESGPAGKLDMPELKRRAKRQGKNSKA
jgi:antitoxin ParD1/3/4